MLFLRASSLMPCKLTVYCATYHARSPPTILFLYICPINAALFKPACFRWHSPGPTHVLPSPVTINNALRPLLWPAPVLHHDFSLNVALFSVCPAPSQAQLFEFAETHGLSHGPPRRLTANDVLCSLLWHMAASLHNRPLPGHPREAHHGADTGYFFIGVDFRGYAGVPKQYLGNMMSDALIPGVTHPPV